MSQATGTLGTPEFRSFRPTKSDSKLVSVYSQPGDAVTYDDGIYEGLDSGNLGVISPEDGAYVRVQIR